MTNTTKDTSTVPFSPRASDNHQSSSKGPCVIDNFLDSSLDIKVEDPAQSYHQAS